MGRHAAELPPEPPGPRPLRHGRDGSRPGPIAAWGRLLAAALVVAVALGGGAWFLWQLTGDGTTENTAAGTGDDEGPGADGCAATEEVLVMTARATEEAVREVLADVPTPADGPCVNARVIDRDPADVLADLAAGGGPDVWVADSSVWAAQAVAGGATVEQRGSMGASPVTVVTGRAAAEALGWTEQPPSWAEVLGSGRAIAVGDLRREVPPLLALAAGMQAAEGRMNELAAALALGQRRANAPSADLGLQAVSGTDAQAPLVILGEVDAARLGVTDDGPLVAVAPTGPVAPVLDYPVLSVPAPARSASSAAAVTAVVEALTSADGLEAAGRSGLAPPVGEADPVLRTFSAEELARFADAFEALATPVQLLVVVDVSTSMLAPVPGAGSRAEVAAQALANALGALPDESRVGLWYFANDVEGDRDYREVLPVERLDAARDGGTHRMALAAQLGELPRSLLPGGTSLYQVTLDAVAAGKELRTEGYDTTVVLITDGQNEDSAGPTRDQVVAALQQEDLGSEPFETLGFLPIAFGTDADLEAVTSLAAAAQGLGGLVQPVNATDALALEQLLVTGLSARIPTEGSAGR